MLFNRELAVTGWLMREEVQNADWFYAVVPDGFSRSARPASRGWISKRSHSPVHHRLAGRGTFSIPLSVALNPAGFRGGAVRWMRPERRGALPT